MKTAILTTTTTAIAAALAFSPVAAEPVSHEIVFVDHIGAGMPEQDVYIEGPSGEEVFRPGASESDLSAPLYAAANSIPHNPADPNAVGPYPKGAPLDMTLGDWLGAEGAGTYVCDDNGSHLRVEFTGLVPQGEYTIWHFFMSAKPTETFLGTYDLPIGNVDGSQSVFKADADGNGVFDQTFENCLQLSGEQLAAGLALNWHSDGKTYGVLPGDFGLNAHIQLFAVLPAS